jgi:putative serine protease PepD
LRTGTSAGASVKINSVDLAQSDQAPPASTLTGTVKSVLPAVVNIHSTQLSANPFGGSQTSKAEGSGVILSKDGVILTNNHVIAGATKVSVSFTDGTHKQLDGTVIGTDPQHDIALVKVAATDLTPITLGHSSKLQLGDTVAALGFPLDLGGPTVTEGIVSGLGRDITVSDGASGGESLKNLIQTDAAINPGNSGGALVDSNGNLVGIDTAAASAASAENTGFAIPIDDIVPIVQKIVKQKPAPQAWIGVQVESVTTQVAQQVGLPASTRGALIAAVVPGGPAASSSLRSGDVIQSVDGHAIGSADDLTSALADNAPGDKVTLGILTPSGNRDSIQVTLGPRPAA